MWKNKITFFHYIFAILFLFFACEKIDELSALYGNTPILISSFLVLECAEIVGIILLIFLFFQFAFWIKRKAWKKIFVISSSLVFVFLTYTIFNECFKKKANDLAYTDLTNILTNKYDIKSKYNIRCEEYMKTDYNKLIGHLNEASIKPTYEYPLWGEHHYKVIPVGIEPFDITIRKSFDRSKRIFVWISRGGVSMPPYDSENR